MFRELIFGLRLLFSPSAGNDVIIGGGSDWRAWVPSKMHVIGLLALVSGFLAGQLYKEKVAHRMAIQGRDAMVAHVVAADARVQRILRMAADDIEAIRASQPKKFPVQKPVRTYVSK